MDNCQFCGQSFPFDQMWDHVGGCEAAEVNASSVKVALRAWTCNFMIALCASAHSAMPRCPAKILLPIRGIAPRLLSIAVATRNCTGRTLLTIKQFAPRFSSIAAGAARTCTGRTLIAIKRFAPRSASIASAASSFSGRISRPTWQNQLRTSQRLPRMSKGRSATWKL